VSVPFKDLPGVDVVPDVDALMESVRAGIADKLGRGVLAPADLDQARRGAEALLMSTEPDAASAADVARLHSLWNPLGPYPFSSHRSGAGRLIVAAKRGLRRLVEPVAALTLARQAEFNGAVARLLAGATHGVQSLNAGNPELLRRIDVLERRYQDLYAECDGLRATVRGLQARLEPAGAAGQPGKPPVTLAFVVPWFGDEVRGGAEMQGWETARELSRRGCRVEVLTTCSRSFLHRWDENHHAPGVSEREGVTVRRFPVDRRDEAQFAAACEAVLSGAPAGPALEATFVRESINSSALYRFIAENAERYLFAFTPYLYGTTLAGAAVRPDRSLLIPCLHEEPYVRLDVVRRTFLGVRGSLFFTPEEAAVARRACGGEPPGRVTGGGSDTRLRGDAERFRALSGVRDPYVLYLGRLDQGKNTHLVMAYAREWARRHAGAARLVLLGRGPLAIPPGEPAFVAAGVLDEQGKMDACAGALALCQPSVNESFSRVIMESWVNEVPVLVHADCAVTVGHCRRSGGGLWFRDAFEFSAALDLLAGDQQLRCRLGAAGRRYVLAECSWDTVCARIVQAVAELTGERLVDA
jgi:glycosyltransferase involved in cell wall biosynthesis